MIRDKARICFVLTKGIAFRDTIEFYLFIYFFFHPIIRSRENLLKIFDSLLESRFNHVEKEKERG